MRLRTRFRPESILTLVCCVLGASASVLAQEAPNAVAASDAAPRPCRVTFELTTSGGDVLTQRGEATLSRYVPDAGGGFMMFGSGSQTGTLEAARACRVVAGSPFTEPVQVILLSDGRNAEIDITPAGTEHPIRFDCRGSIADYSVATEALSTVTLPLRHGATGEFSESFRTGRVDGSVTLEFCGADGAPLAEPNIAGAGSGGAGAVPSDEQPSGGPGSAEVCAEENDDDCTDRRSRRRGNRGPR